MPTAVVCSSCQFRGTVPDSFAGKGVRCRKCNATIAVATTGNRAAAAAVSFSEFEEGYKEQVADDDSATDDQESSASVPQQRSTFAFEDNSPTFPDTMSIIIAEDNTSWFDKGFRFGCGFIFAQFFLALILAGLYFVLGQMIHVGR